MVVPPSVKDVGLEVLTGNVVSVGNVEVTASVVGTGVVDVVVTTDVSTGVVLDCCVVTLSVVVGCGVVGPSANNTTNIQTNFKKILKML